MTTKNSSVVGMKRVVVQKSSPLLSFQEHEGMEALSIDGKPAVGCCFDFSPLSSGDFHFQRLQGAERNLGPEELTDQFRTGVGELSDDVLDGCSLILPAGDYWVALMNINPLFVRPGSGADYFCAEQAAQWPGDDPNDPRTNYYRATTCQLDQRDFKKSPEFITAMSTTVLFEFVVPLLATTELELGIVRQYQEQIDSGVVPTAFSVGLMSESVHCAQPQGGPLTRHLYLIHYLLDGHHKIHAAAKLQKPIELVSFIRVWDEALPRLLLYALRESGA